MDVRIEKNWDAMSRAYEDFTAKGQSYSYQIEWPCIKQLLPDLNSMNILDLGGGTGRFGFLFEEYSPKSILVVDISQEMLDIGKEKAKKGGVYSIAFQKGDISHLDNIADETFDFVFSSTTFHYLEKLQPVFNTVNRLLKRGGKSIISVMHPFYTAQYPIDKNGDYPTDDDWETQYFNKDMRSYVQPWIEYNDDIENYLSTSYHHTISDYINSIIQAGLIIDKVAEPLPPDAWESLYPERYESLIETPLFMVLSLSKQGA